MRRRLIIAGFCQVIVILQSLGIYHGKTEDVQQGQKVTISQSHALILLYGSTGFTAVPHLFCNESVLYPFFAISNTTCSSSTVPFMNDFLRYNLANLYDLGQ